jgi:hypothetical protein
MTLLTKDQMVKKMMEALDKAVSDFPVEKREETKANILNAWGKFMFYGGGPTKGKNT